VGVPPALRRISADGWALIAIAAVVALANLPYLSGVFDADPLGPRAGLAGSIVPGPVIGQPTIDPNNGFVSQALGHLAAEDLIHLRLPWWNPYQGTGAPLVGEMQSAAFFPPTLLTLAANGQLYEHLLLELLAGICTFRLLRRLTLSRWASTAGGAAFALNGTFAWFAHAPVNPIAFLPMLLLGVERAYAAAQDGRRGGWPMIAVAGALSVYAGFPEVAYIDTVLAVVWFAWRCGGLDRRDRRALLVKGAAGAVVGSLLAAPFLIAGIDYVSHGDLGTHASSIYGSTHIAAAGIPALLLPYVYGPVFAFTGPSLQVTSIWSSVGGYESTSLLLLAALGLCARGRRGLRIVLAAWIVLVLARMYGQVPFLGHVVGWLPGMDRVAFFRYATASMELAVVILAALGINDLATVADHRPRALWGALGFLALVAAAAIGAHPLAAQLGPQYSRHPYFVLAIAWAVAAVLVVAAAGLIRDARRRGALLTAILAVDALVLFMVPELSAPRSVTVDRKPAAYLARHLGNGRFFTLGPLQPNYGSYFDLASLNINDIPIPSALAGYVHRRLDPYVNPTVLTGNLGGRSLLPPSPEQELERDLAGYRAAGVSYVLAPAGRPLPQSPASLTLVDRSPTTAIYHLAGAAPFFSAGDPRCRTRSAGVDTVTISCPGPATLVRRETFMPGWSASIDGHGEAIVPGDGPFQAVSVAAGSHRVTFSYTPPGIVWGWLAFAAGAVGLIAAPGPPRRRRRDGAWGPTDP
jgi:hypothetical protein